MTNRQLQVLQAVLTAAPCLLRAPAVALVVAVSRRAVDVGDPEDEVGKGEPGPNRQAAAAAVDRPLPLRVGVEVEVTPGPILDQFLEAILDLLFEDGDRHPSPLVILKTAGQRRPSPLVILKTAGQRRPSLLVILKTAGQRRPSPLVILKTAGHPEAETVLGQRTHAMTSDVPNARGSATLDAGNFDFGIRS
jgi:hypothetical protein